MLRRLLSFYGVAAILLFLLDVWICWLAYRTYQLMKKGENTIPSGQQSNGANPIINVNGGTAPVSASQASTLEAV